MKYKSTGKYTAKEKRIKTEVIEMIEFCERMNFNVKDIIGSLGIGIYRQGIMEGRESSNPTYRKE